MSVLLAWALVVALAVGIRIWFWSFQAQSGAIQPGDPEEYYRSALHLMQGGYYDTGKWLRPPLYPLFLALCFAAGGISTTQTLLAQAILTGLAIPAFGLLTYQLVKSHSAALLSGLIAALFVPLASFGSVLFAEALFVLLMIVSLWALDRTIQQQSVQAGLLAGALLALAALTRALALNYIPIAAVLIVLLPHPSLPQAEETLRSWSKGRLRLAGAFLLGAAIVISPWALRNMVVHQRLILSDTNGGISMWYGVVRTDEEQLAGEAQLWAIANPADRQSLALRWTVARIVEDPGWFIERMRYKVASLYLLQTRSYAVGDIITIDPRGNLVAMGAGENSLTLSLIADGQYLLIMFVGIAGAAFFPDRRRLIPLLVWIAFATLMSAVTIGHPRLRLPIVATLIPCAAYAVVALFGWLWRSGGETRRQGDKEKKGGLARRRRARIAITLAGWLVMFALVFSTRYLTWARTWPEISKAEAAAASAEYSAAEEALLRARALDPANALRAIDLADIAFRRGEYARALALYEEATALEDRNLYAHTMVARIAGLLQKPAVAGQAQASLAGYGRDNNEVYSWAWAIFDDPPQRHVTPGDPAALGQYTGFAPATPDLPTGRWTLGDARIRLVDGCGVLRVVLQGPPGRRVSIGVERRVAPQTVQLTGERQEIQLALACDPAQPAVERTAPPALVAGTGGFQRLALVVRITSETGLLDIEHAPWAVGIAVLEAGLDDG